MRKSTSKTVDYESVGADYLERRALKRGAAGWMLLATLGVSYVISGDFAGWNLGLAAGGFGGLLVATVLMGLMYTCMVFALAELSACLPNAGGGYSFARRALGPWGGYITGTAILLEYAIAPAAIVIFIGGYLSSLIGVDGPLVYALFYLAFVGLHLWGTGEALKILLVITGIAAVAIVIFVLAMIPYFDVANLFDIPVGEGVGASVFLPHGYFGIWACLPFAIWFFLAVEGVPLAAEESRDPGRDMPRGIIAAMMVLLVFAACVLLLTPGGAGAQLMSESAAPLVDALNAAYGPGSWVAGVVNLVGLAGLIASFFSIIFGYSRQVFALSRAGYLPRWLSVTNARRAPTLALVVPGVIGFLLSLTGQGDLMITMAVFGATISYAMMMLSHLLLRAREPDLPRPYRTPGGRFTSVVALVLALVAFVSTFLVSLQAALWSAVFYALMLAYFGFYSRKRLVAQAPEEEFEAIKRAEAELG